jgi:hypothetical protein
MRRLPLLVALALPAVVFAAPDYAPLDQLFAQRDQPGMTDKLLTGLDAALQKDPKDYGLLWRKARIVQWQADGETDSDKKKLLGKQCWATSDEALAAKPGGMEASYYGSVCIGAYSQAVGILKALGEGLEGKFNERLDRAIAADPKFMGCAPLIAKGRYYYELPWPKRDLDKSVEFLKKAETGCPTSLRAPLYLAETELKKDGAMSALVALNPAIKGGVDYDPPEGKRVKALIPKVQKEIQEEMH